MSTFLLQTHVRRSGRLYSLCIFGHWWRVGDVVCHVYAYDCISDFFFPLNQRLKWPQILIRMISDQRMRKLHLRVHSLLTCLPLRQSLPLKHHYWIRHVIENRPSTFRVKARNLEILHTATLVKWCAVSIVYAGFGSFVTFEASVEKLTVVRLLYWRLVSHFLDQLPIRLLILMHNSPQTRLTLHYLNLPPRKSPLQTRTVPIQVPFLLLLHF